MALGIARFAAEAALLPSCHLASGSSGADRPAKFAALGAAHTAAV